LASLGGLVPVERSREQTFVLSIGGSIHSFIPFRRASVVVLANTDDIIQRRMALPTERKCRIR
jgi:hypothetical protein